MLKPNDYDSISAYGDYEPLEIGGHILVIQAVKETKSKSGKPMLEISLDTAPDDIQPGYYMDRWKSDSRPSDQKRWGCIVYQLTEDSTTGGTNRGLKTFITSVEESNPGFIPQWGDNFGPCFKGKRVGGIFRREQYANQKGELKWSTKCMSFRSVQKIMDGVEPPDDKYLDGHNKPSGSGATASNDFAVLAGSDAELPF